MLAYSAFKLLYLLYNNIYQTRDFVGPVSEISDF